MFTALSPPSCAPQGARSWGTRGPALAAPEGSREVGAGHSPMSPVRGSCTLILSHRTGRLPAQGRGELAEPGVEFGAVSSKALALGEGQGEGVEGPATLSRGG